MIDSVILDFHMCFSKKISEKQDTLRVNVQILNKIKLFSRISIGGNKTLSLEKRETEREIDRER